MNQSKARDSTDSILAICLIGVAQMPPPVSIDAQTADNTLTKSYIKGSNFQTNLVSPNSYPVIQLPPIQITLIFNNHELRQCSLAPFGHRSNH